MDNEQVIEIQELGSYEDDLLAYQRRVNAYLEYHYDEVRDGYREMLKDCWEYDGCDLDEVDDGRWEYVEESYEEATGNKRPTATKKETLDF